MYNLKYRFLCELAYFKMFELVQLNNLNKTK